MIEDATYIVHMTFTGTIDFSPIERERAITQQDAIDNAMGTLPEEFFKMAEAEGWDVEFSAERVV